MIIMTSRRRFIEITPVAGFMLLTACSPKSEVAPPAVTTSSPVAPPPVATPTPAPAPPPAPTADLPMVDEKDAQALALGYVADATRADQNKFKSYVAGRQCSNCAFYLGKAGDSAGGCPLFPNKHVAAKGWCNSWIKKA